MAEYRALYRKHRPQRFSEVVGQGHVTETLSHEVVGGSIAHAYLFAGPRGTGKTTTARILAKALNCSDRGSDGEPCNDCPSCLSITEGNSMDVIELDAASHNKVEDVREIRANVGTVASVGGARRVYILDEAHMLSRAAANALLKTLEEPPDHAHFVLATTEPYKLPDTIRSRTQRFDFHPIGSEVMIDHLRAVASSEAYEASPEGLALIARHAGGSARDALGLMEQVAALGAGSVAPKGVTRALGLADDEAYSMLVKAIAAQDAAATLTLVSSLAGAGTDLRRFVTDSVEFFRGLFLAHYAPNLDEIVDEPADVLDTWRSHARLLDPGDVLRCIDRLGEALVELRDGREERLVVELALLQMARPETAPDTASLAARLDRLEERMRLLHEGAVPVSEAKADDEPAPAPAVEVSPDPEPEPVSSPVIEPEPEVAASDHVVETEAAAPVATISLEAVDEAWPALVARVREQAGPRRHALFREVRPVDVEGGDLVLEVPAHLSFHLAQLSEDDRLTAIVTSVASELLGAAVEVVFRAGEEQAVQAPVEQPQLRAPDEDQLVPSGEGGIDPTSLVVDTFGGEVVSDD